MADSKRGGEGSAQCAASKDPCRTSRCMDAAGRLAGASGPLALFVWRFGAACQRVYVALTPYPAAHALLPCTHTRWPQPNLCNTPNVAHALLPWAPKDLAPTLPPHPLVLTIPTQPVQHTASCPAQPPLAPTPYPQAHTFLPCVPQLVTHLSRKALAQARSADIDAWETSRQQLSLLPCRAACMHIGGDIQVTREV